MELVESPCTGIYRITFPTVTLLLSCEMVQPVLSAGGPLVAGVLANQRAPCLSTNMAARMKAR